MKNAANVIPGQFEARGHDYRADLARFVREVYGLKASDDQLATVEAGSARLRDGAQAPARRRKTASRL